MLNRIPRNLPPFSVLADSIGASTKTLSKTLHVSERTIKRWIQTDAPYTAKIAVFWLTPYGWSVVDSDLTNAIRIYAGLARAQADALRKRDNLSDVKKAARAANDAVFRGFHRSQNNTQCRKYVTAESALMARNAGSGQPDATPRES